MSEPAAEATPALAPAVTTLAARAQLLGWLAGLVLLLVLVLLVARYSVDAPVLDQWSLVYDLAKYADGTWTANDILRLHNGHRIAIPRLILVPLAQLTGWDVRVEMALGIVFAVLLWVLLATSLPAPRRPAWWPAATALVTFSLAQWENWLWGIQMHVPLAVLLALLALRCLAPPILGWPHLVLAAATGVAATYCQASGLVVWPLGLLAIASGRGRRWLPATAWTLLGGAVVWWYLQPLPGDAGVRPDLAFVLDHPLRYLYFVATTLGAPAVGYAGSAWPPREHGAGVLALALAIALGWLALRAGRWRALADDPALRFVALTALFSAAVAAQIGIGRASFGPAAAMASRYVTLTTPLFVAVLAAHALGATPGRRARNALAVILLASFGLASATASRQFPGRQRVLEPARTALAEMGDRALLARLHPELNQVLGQVGTLQTLRLSVFRRGAPPLVATGRRLSGFGQILAPIDPPPELAAGSSTELTVRVTNTGAEPWSAHGDGNGQGSVRLSYHWIVDHQVVVFDGLRTLLPHDLEPGATIELAMAIAAPPSPGSYRLVLTAVQEGVCWFDACGGAPTVIPLELTSSH